MLENSRIFVTTAGDPISFFVDLSKCRCLAESVKKKIVSHGGVTVNEASGMDQYTVHLVDEISVNQTPYNSPMFFYKFVEDCAKESRLLNLQDYLAFNVPCFAHMDFQNVVLEKNGRMRYSKIKDLLPRRDLLRRRAKKLNMSSTVVVSSDARLDVGKEFEVFSHASVEKCRDSDSSTESLPETQEQDGVRADDSDQQDIVEISVPIEDQTTLPPFEPLDRSTPVNADIEVQQIDDQNRAETAILPEQSIPCSSAQHGASHPDTCQSSISSVTSSPLEPSDGSETDKSARRAIKSGTRSNLPSSQTKSFIRRAKAELNPPPGARLARVRNFNTRAPFSNQEKVIILKYLLSLPRTTGLRGNVVWRDLEDLNLCPSRSHQSLKNHFRKTLVKELDQYKFLSSDERKWLKGM